ncbi:MAG: AraC family transcriptional regulator [Clostridia bacterium]|nr:AraC family transcriptional regulator [Clostridia bacterium]
MPKKSLKYKKIKFPEADFALAAYPYNLSFNDNLDDVSKLFHEEIELKLFLEGSSTIMIDNETIVANEGDIVIMNPYQIHFTVNSMEEKAKYHLILIGLDFFENNIAFFDLRYLFTKEHARINNVIRGNHRIAEIIKNIADEFSNKKAMYHTVITNLVSELIALLLREYRTNNATAYPIDKNMRFYEIIYPALAKLRNDYAEKISIDELARMCNVSKYHFCRIFKEVTSVSALQYQIQCRLAVADVLLNSTDKSISEIAESCGFDDICYFSRCYKKNRGVSPKEKRARMSK